MPVMIRVVPVMDPVQKLTLNQNFWFIKKNNQ